MFKLPKSSKPKTIVLTSKQLKAIHPGFLLDPLFIRRLTK
ncbi:hypothetical protein YUYDRAFT_03347 [Streptomyces sp. ScaeMP-e48]|nr:hypothetical protein YUYDRAFT_03347 [Streptomyces sp. ScaeMP-e48]